MPRRSIKQYSAPQSRKAATKLDVAHEQQVSLRTVDAWIHDRRIPVKRLGPRLLRFDLDEVERALARYTIEAIK